MKNDDEVKPDYRIAQSLTDGLRLLEHVVLRRQHASLASIVRQLQWDKGKVRRLLRALVNEGFLGYDPLDKTYMPGGKILELHDNTMQTLRIQPRFSHRFLEELAKNTGETAVLAILQGEKMLTVDVVMNHDVIKIITGVGAFGAPPFCVAHGRVFLAEMPSSSVTQFLKNSNVRAYTSKTVTNIKEILKELEQVRAQGYSITEGEFRPNTSSVVAPVHDSMQVIASVGVLLSVARVPEERRENLIEQVKGIAQSMEDSIVRGNSDRLFQAR